MEHVVAYFHCSIDLVRRTYSLLEFVNPPSQPATKKHNILSFQPDAKENAKQAYAQATTTQRARQGHTMCMPTPQFGLCAKVLFDHALSSEDVRYSK